MKKILALLLVCTARLSAQLPITEAQLTPEVAAALVAFHNGPETLRLSGDLTVNAGNEMSGRIAVLEGTLTLAGHIKGDVVVINGSGVFLPGAHVDGKVTVVGGSLRGADQLSATHVLWYRDRLKYDLRDGELVLARDFRPGELSAGRDFGFGRTDLLVAARGGYNRSEGLPIHMGPRLTFGRANPTVLEGTYILRTVAAFHFDEHDYGYALRAEQYLGGRKSARMGVRIASEVLPVELWGLSDRENSLATFVLHRDYRDHYNRDGWSAYLAAGRAGMPLDWRLEYSELRFENAPLRDPYSLFDNPDPWRPELATPSVHLHTLRAQLRYDTRNEDRDPASGWLARGDVEMALYARGDTVGFNDDYRFASLDVRRFARLSPNSRLALRAVAAGSPNGDPLPNFRQQSLGGFGSLPAYQNYEFDCGGHDGQFRIAGRSAFYGCDRLLLLQVEYQARFRWLSRLGRRIGRDFGLLENVRGVLFFDTGRSWNEPESVGARTAGSHDFVADAGFGLRFSTLGAYWAVPLTARAQGLRFFVRAEPRI